MLERKPKKGHGAPPPPNHDGWEGLFWSLAFLGEGKQSPCSKSMLSSKVSTISMCEGRTQEVPGEV